MMTPTSPSRLRRVASRIAGARRRAAVVTSAALLAAGAGVTIGAPAPQAEVAIEAPARVVVPDVPAAEVPVALVSHLDDAPEVEAELAPAAEAGTPIGTGLASYYGRELAGNPTASGEPFDPSDLTAAHRTLPLGTRVRVTHERTGESVVVRVNDRGPFHGDRVLDLSRAAADAIGLTKRGTGTVSIERLGGARG
ncbi:septal ring lytic transglycosylase RlpA family protein [Rubrivirga sp. IMCC43871]|uniref:septal ring lytic transglycosylase RlpA family protein n=1 Tax=Rubrivirga sp. IMCC43871 TaxID=3391575 RepID=UPI00398FBB21